MIISNLIFQLTHVKKIESILKYQKIKLFISMILLYSNNKCIDA